MSGDLRILVQPVKRAATVDNARLQGLHIVRCECHGMLRCPSLDTLIRRAEGPNLPVGYVPDDPIAEVSDDDGFALLVWAVALTATVVTAYSLGSILYGWLTA